MSTSLHSSDNTTFRILVNELFLFIHYHSEWYFMVKFISPQTCQIDGDVRNQDGDMDPQRLRAVRVEGARG